MVGNQTLDKMDKKIDYWKSQLLDFSRRNRLLNFKKTKATIKLEVESNHIYNLLMDEKKQMVRKCVDLESEAKKLTKDAIDSEKSISKDEIDKIYQDNLNKVIKKFETQLNGIRLRGKSSLDEKGINTLYLAIGLLEWREVEHSKDFIKSPILLMPLKLQRQSGKDPYFLEKLDEEVVLNPILEQKLKLDFGIEVTPFEQLEAKSFEEIMNVYQSELKVEDSWEIHNEVNIGLFSFSKLVMFKDFENYEEYIKNNPFIKKIAGEELEDDICNREDIKDISIVDRKLKSEESYQVLDADSSQQEAIIAAKNNVSFVLQGPPGTGKSQTITNIIAELLAKGKKVLFVSEKKAALDVVKKRLDDVNLGDYILDLHSHESNKKTILEELKRSVDVVTSPFNIDQYFSDLDEIKNLLNSYVDALHKTVQPLNQKPQAIHGKLSQLNDVQDVIFDIPNVELVSSEKLRTILKKVNRLDDIKEHIVSLEEHIWKGATVKETSFELETKISSIFNQLSEHLNKLIPLLKSVTEYIGFTGTLSLNTVDHVLDIKRSIENKPDVPGVWFNEHEAEILTQAKKHYAKFKELFKRYFQFRNGILKEYNENVFDLNLNEMNHLLNEKHRAKLSEVTNDYEIFIDKMLSQKASVLSLLNNIRENLNNITDFKNELELITHVQLSQVTIDEISFHNELVEYIKDVPRPTEAWFDGTRKEEIREVLLKGEELQNEYHLQKNDLAATFDLEILEEDLQGILNSFINEYSSLFRVFNKKYKKDRRLIRSYLTNKQKLNDQNIVKRLRKLVKLKTLQSEITDNKMYYTDLFGSNYNGADTDWKTMSKNVGNILALGTYLHKKDQNNYQQFIIGMDLTSFNSYKELVSNLHTSYEKAVDDWDALKSMLHVDKLVVDSDPDLLNSNHDLDLLKDVTTDFYKTKDLLSKVALNEADITMAGINELIENTSELHELENRITNSASFLEKTYGDLYEGLATNWDKISLALNWIEKANNNFDGWFPKEFVEIINSSEKYSIFKKDCGQLTYYLEKAEEFLKFFDHIFPPSVEKFNGLNIYQIELSEATANLNSLANNTSLLQEWITLKEAISDLEQEGLQSLVQKVNDIDKEFTFESVFLKRFYKLWLDRVYRDNLSLKNFRIDQHKNLLREFKELDENTLGENSARIHSLLTRNKRSYIQNHAHKSSEMAFLNREFQKKKRHKPIRVLLSNLTNLLLSIKPCMMMSPLSVSQYINPSNIQFDVVIFDEASQIRPEDAIGTIMRGKQVIISGDNKQLPPTSFFNNQVEIDEEFIDEEDEDIYETFESILDETLLFMPELSLKWHYRSKQESLIAFSNREIYNNELYTFPNAMQGDADGVSFVHVEDGIYDRGKSNKNIKEAEAVAKLVFDHFKLKPNRSLGVIAFSQTQQIAIQDKMYEMREDMPEFEHFFDENKLDSFFVKNLENVQGDERDTIILSVGYGKDANGTIYYNFGPLNKEGGHRRLNVAVTRAKMELITVSSILDLDLDEAKLNKRGPQLLKAYLSYSRNGGEFSNITGVQNGFFDSPFEEDVYRTLEEKGLRLHTQVGSSGYRIDLGVVDPNYPGKYLLGIECDGASYHSSKTARDRDRLRQSVLESLGWKIERIWSQDWVKRKNEIANEIVEKVNAIITL